MKNAKKLSILFPKINVDDIDLVLDSGENKHVIFEGRAGVTRYKIPRTLNNEILNCLPEQFQTYVFCINLSKIQSAVPHYHTYDTTVVNYYINTDNYETTFYESKSEIIQTETEFEFPIEGLIQVVNLDSVVPIEKFVANSGDVYALNSRAIHSVSQIENNQSSYNKFRPIKEEKRFAIQIWTKCPFQLAYEILP